MTHIILSKKRCLPCRQLHSIVEAKGLDWTTKWHHEEPDFFDALAVKSAPSLVRELGYINGKKHYKVVAIGLQEIQMYMNGNMNYNEEEE